MKQNQILKIKVHCIGQINESVILEIYLIKCENPTDNNNHCKSKEKFDNYLENVYVILIYVSKNIDHYNDIPIKQYFPKNSLFLVKKCNQ